MEIITEQPVNQPNADTKAIAPKQPLKVSKRQIILTIVVILISIAIAAIILLLTANFRQVDMVKKELQNAQSVMNQAYDQNKTYPATIDGLISVADKDIHISGNTSFDGASYCLEAYNTKDTKQIYHVRNDQTSVLDGSCKSDTGSIPPKVSIPYVSLVGQDRIEIGWRSSNYAENYTLQCSTDSAFKQIASEQRVSITDGVCIGLKSNTEYYFRVNASNKSGTSSWSDSGKIRTY